MTTNRHDPNHLDNPAFKRGIKGWRSKYAEWAKPMAAWFVAYIPPLGVLK